MNSPASSARSRVMGRSWFGESAGMDATSMARLGGREKVDLQVYADQDRRKWRCEVADGAHLDIEALDTRLRSQSIKFPHFCFVVHFSAIEPNTCASYRNRIISWMRYVVASCCEVGWPCDLIV
jgi:hypothetical protein